MTPADPVQQARLMLAQGRASEAVALTRKSASRRDAAAPLLSAHTDALKAAGRIDEAVTFARRAAEAAPTSMVTRHNLAALLGDASLNAEAEQAARQAFDLGGDAPETWLVLARALQGQNRFEEAEASYREALNRRPGYAEALNDLAQLIWMKDANLDAALQPVDAAIANHGQTVGLRIIKARLLEYAGDARGGYAALTQAALDSAGHLVAAQTAIQFDPDLALRHAAAAQQGGSEKSVRIALAEALIATGRAGEALIQARAVRAGWPDDQYGIALEATALRLLGDAAYRGLYDYEAFVRRATIDTPPGWDDLSAYLADLAQALGALHQLKTHPVGQSLRHGSQTTASLKRSSDPAVKAFFKAIDGPVRRYMKAIGRGPDPLRARNIGAYEVAGAWSVRLRPNGFHADHVHPQGWLSSACYIDLPKAVSGEGREGWIKFGQPAMRTDPPLDPEHFVKPEPGLLVLFPSYMWHGTVPFSGDDTRLTVAFDVVPRRR